MKFRPPPLLEKISGRQKLLASGLIGVGLVAFLVFGPEDGAPSPAEDVSDIERVVMDLTRGGRAEKSWLATAEGTFAALETRLRHLESDRDRLSEENRRLTDQNAQTEQQYREDQANALQALDAQAAEIARLRADLESATLETGTLDSRNQASQTLPSEAPSGRVPETPNASPFPDSRGLDSPFVRRTPSRRELAVAGPEPAADPAGSLSEGSTAVSRDPVGLVHFDLETPVSPYKSLEAYVPAGAYAPAVVISGVDAGVGVEVQSDPRPVLFRITGPAVSAALEGAPQKADLTGCTVTGAAIGDLSSEKVYVRLQQMTCSRTAGEVFEVAVEGYMTGAGKAGVRGLVVSREGDLARQAFVAGAISGIGQSLAQATTPGLSPVSGAVGAITTEQQQSLSGILKGAAGRGVGNAGDRIADYLIRRAEQYQPVVVMQAGTSVELVFIKGVSLEPDRLPEALPVQGTLQTAAPVSTPPTGVSLP